MAVMETSNGFLIGGLLEGFSGVQAWGFRGRRVRGLLVMIPMMPSLMGGECRHVKYYLDGLEIESGLGS